MRREMTEDVIREMTDDVIREPDPSPLDAHPLWPQRRAQVITARLHNIPYIYHTQNVVMIMFKELNIDTLLFD